MILRVWTGLVSRECWEIEAPGLPTAKMIKQEAVTGEDGGGTENAAYVVVVADPTTVTETADRTSVSNATGKADAGGDRGWPLTTATPTTQLSTTCGGRLTASGAASCT